MKIINVEPVTSEDSRLTVEYNSNHVIINSDITPIICSEEQADRLGEILRNPQKLIPDNGSLA